MRVLKFLLIGFGSLTAFVSLTTTAHAIGLCEDIHTSYGVEGVVKGGAFILVRADRAWCDDEEGDAPESPDGTTMLVFNAKGRVVARFDSPAPTHGMLSELTIGDEVEPQPLAAFAAWRQDHAVVPAAELLDKPSAPCAGSITSRSVKSGEGEFPRAAAKYVVKRGRKTIWSKRLGEVDMGSEGPRVVVKLFEVPGSKRLLLWVETGVCHGPPPGYFGSDDGGECSAQWTPMVRLTWAPDALKGCRA